MIRSICKRVLQNSLARAHKAETRKKKLYLAEEAKVPANVGILRSIITMRDSQARLLGYDNHGSFRIQNRAIKSTEYVQKFLSHLKRSLVPHGRDELQTLRQTHDEHRLLVGNIASDKVKISDSSLVRNSHDFMALNFP